MKKILRSISRYILLDCLALTACSLCIAMIPYLEKQFIDLFTGDQLSIQNIGYLVLAFALTVVTYLVTNTGAMYFSFLESSHFEKNLRDTLFQKQLDRRNRLLTAEEKSRFTQQMTVEITQLEEDWLQPTIEELQGVVQLVVYIGFIYITLDWRVAVGLLVIAVAGVTATRAFQLDSAAKRKRYLEQNAKTVQFMDQAVGGASTIRENCAQQVLTRAAKETWNSMNARLRYGKAKAAEYSVNNGVSYIAMLLFFAYVGVLSYSAQMPVSTAIVSFGYIDVVIQGINTILICHANRKSAGSISSKFEAELKEQSSCRIRYDEVNTIQAEHICYTAGGKEILQDVSFTIKRGESCVIHGHNGAGKSTLLKLILNLIRPTDGKICINGEDVPDACLYSDMYYVEQSSVIFSASFQENVTMFGAYPIQSLEKYHFLQAPELQKIRSCENCEMLSGGEKQLVCLCRALLSGAHWLILDESFSGVSHALEEEILREILAAKHSLIYISHSDRLDKLFPRTLAVERREM